MKRSGLEGAVRAGIVSSEQADRLAEFYSRNAAPGFTFVNVRWRYRFPFMVLPIAVTLWYMSMDLASFLFGVLAFWGGLSSMRFRQRTRRVPPWVTSLIACSRTAWFFRAASRGCLVCARAGLCAGASPSL